MSGTATQAVPRSATAWADLIVARCRELALLTDVAGETTRTFLSPAMHEVHAMVGGWMRRAGMAVHVDAAGNLRGLLRGSSGHAPRLLIGSHLDTIANAGAFDGILGVVMGVALAEHFAEQGSALPFGLEVIGFSEEEGVRFAMPFLGSLALIGELDEATLARTDREGTSVQQAIRDFGLDPEQLPAAAVDGSAFGYLEFHIEQGPLLESEGAALAVVEAIAGQTRMQLTFHGQANHAGTTPMGPLRHDALAAAAQWVVEVERYANGTPGLVATVGKVETGSGAGNVIAGEFLATLDVRHAYDEVRAAAVEHFLDYARAAGGVRGVTLSHTTSLQQAAVPMDAALISLLAEAASQATGRAVRVMTSGAGHDAMIVARRLPTAMLFLRSPGGLSHHPAESVLPEDVVAAFATGVEFLEALRSRPSILRRETAETEARETPMHRLGHTRSVNRRDHLLHTPDTFIRTPLPGMQGGMAIVHVSPAAGAAFTQYTAELEAGGTLGPATAQRFVYVLSGSADIATDTTFRPLTAGSYAYLPAGCVHTLTAHEATRLAVIEKPYQPLAGVAAPALRLGHETEVAPVALMGDPDLEVRSLLPDDAAFDFAVNTMTYRPGAALSMVEVHVMEHGLLMLEGGGIYRLGEAWYPVTAGDFIWMAPYCPQWFGALGKQPAKYLIYKDWNRSPLGK